MQRLAAAGGEPVDVDALVRLSALADRAAKRARPRQQTARAGRAAARHAVACKSSYRQQPPPNNRDANTIAPWWNCLRHRRRYRRAS